MFGDTKTNIEFLPKWKCPYEECGAENDITDSTRCWKCNKKKPTKSGYKRILTKIQKKKEQQDAAEVQTKKDQMQVLEDDYDESSTAIQATNQETDLEFDLNKLKSE